ncbi:MAG: GNAT family N-acetyltransferase [Gemmataceae bacterium]
MTAILPTQRVEPSTALVALASKSDGNPERTVRVVSTVSELESYVHKWEALGRDAVDLNPFYEPWSVMPALKGSLGADNIQFVFVVDPANEAEAVCGFFPLQYDSRFRGLPIGVYRLWSHKHCPVRMPLLKHGEERACLVALLNWLHSQASRASFFELQAVNSESAFVTHLLGELDQRRAQFHETACAERVVMSSSGSDSDAYFSNAVGKKRWKKLNKLRRQLIERGTLATELLLSPDELENWLGDFLRLEAKGWKGRNGTALVANPAEREFFLILQRYGDRF